MGNDGNLVYNHGSMHDGAGAIEAALGRLRQQLDDVEGSFSPIETTWQGTAREAYRDRKKQWNDAAIQIADILRKVGSSLVESSDNMRATDQRAARFFQKH